MSARKSKKAPPRCSRCGGELQCSGKGKAHDYVISAKELEDAREQATAQGR